jgi:hypothetical protein
MVSDRLKLAALGVATFVAAFFVSRRGVHRCPLCPKCTFKAAEETALSAYERSLDLKRLSLSVVTETLRSRAALLTIPDLSDLYKVFGIREGAAVTSALQAISPSTPSFRKELFASLLIVSNRAPASQKAKALWELYSSNGIDQLLEDLYLISVTLPFSKAEFTPMRLTDLSHNFSKVKDRWVLAIKSALQTPLTEASFGAVLGGEADFAVNPHATRVWLARSFRTEPPQKMAVKTSAFENLRKKHQISS